MVYGDSLKNCCVGIIVPNPSTVKAWAAENGKCIIIFDYYNFFVSRQKRKRLGRSHKVPGN